MNNQNSVIIFGTSVGIEDPEEFQKLLDRYTQNRGVSAIKRADGAIVMEQKDFDEFLTAREKANLPNSQRLHDIEVRLSQENALFVTENNSSCWMHSGWRRQEEYAQDNFKL